MKTNSKIESDILDLRRTVENFIKASDLSDMAVISNIYATDFLNVRVTDNGEIIRLDRNQILGILSKFGSHSVPTLSTTIQYVEVLGNMGFVLLSRIKDLGNGWEPMFYSLVWKKEGKEWRFSREFVHQRSLPNF